MTRASSRSARTSGSSCRSRAGRLRAGERLELTVRPEKIELAAGPGPAGGCALRGTVTEVVYLGTSTNFSVHHHHRRRRRRLPAELSRLGRRRGQPRATSVWLSWDPQHSYPIG